MSVRFIRGLLHPDVLIVAVGSEYVIPSNLSKNAANCVFPPDVLLDRRKLGNRVVVVGGGLEGCETGMYISETLKKNVTIIEKRGDVLLDCEEPMSLMAIRMRLQFAGVKVLVGLTFKGYSQNKFSCTNSLGEELKLDADSVVLAFGLQPKQDEVAKFDGLARQVFRVGGCVEHEKIFYHTYHAFKSAWRAIFSF